MVPHEINMLCLLQADAFICVLHLGTWPVFWYPSFVLIRCISISLPTGRQLEGRGVFLFDFQPLSVPGTQELP